MTRIDFYILPDGTDTTGDAVMTVCRLCDKAVATGARGHHGQRGNGVRCQPRRGPVPDAQRRHPQVTTDEGDARGGGDRRPPGQGRTLERRRPGVTLEQFVERLKKIMAASDVPDEAAQNELIKMISNNHHKLKVKLLIDMSFDNASPILSNFLSI